VYIATCGESGTRGRHGHEIKPHYRGSTLHRGQAQFKRSFKLNDSGHINTYPKERTASRTACGAVEDTRRERRPTNRDATRTGSPGDGGRAPVPADSRGVDTDSGYSAKATGGYQQYGVQTAAVPDQWISCAQASTLLRSRSLRTQRAQFAGRVTGGASPAVQLRAEKPRAYECETPTAFERPPDTMLPTGGMRRAQSTKRFGSTTQRGAPVATLYCGRGDTQAGGYSVELTVRYDATQPVAGQIRASK
jgi:hypothetical protein